MQKETEVKLFYELKLRKVKIGVTRADWRRTSRRVWDWVGRFTSKDETEIPIVSKYLQNSAVKCPALFSLI